MTTSHEPPAWSPGVYADLRRLADAAMGRERAAHTLQPTALVHEVWLRLLRSRNAGELDRSAFLAVAGQAMRGILTEHARRRTADKRGGGQSRTTLSGKVGARPTPDFVLDVGDALTALEEHDPELVRIAELRFYAGCSVDEIAQTTGLSPRTVKRRWRFARAWLKQRIDGET